MLSITIRLLFIVGLSLFVAVSMAKQQKMTVAFVVPGEEHIPYWSDKVAFMEAVAEDLDIDLRVTYSKANEISLSRSIATVLNAEEKPDYFLTGRWIKVVSSLIRLADRRGIKTLTFNAAFNRNERLLIGHPRENLNNWLGEMSPLDEDAGYRLADILINTAKKQGNVGADGKVRVLSIGAYQGDVVSEARLVGLRRRMAEQSDAVLLDVALAGWRQYIAEEIVQKAFEQHKAVDVIWAASDEMVLGALDAAKKLDLKPGKDFVTGGFDWSSENIDLIMRGDVVTSFGGQFFEGGLAMVLLYDYHHGFDFAKTTGTSMFLPLYPVTKENVQEYKEKLENVGWRGVDFKKFSKVFNPDLKKYDFSLKTVLKELEGHKPKKQ